MSVPGKTKDSKTVSVPSKERQQDLYEQALEEFGQSKYEKVKALTLFLDSEDALFLDEMSLGNLWGLRGRSWCAETKPEYEIRERRIAVSCFKQGIKILDRLALSNALPPETTAEINCRLQEQRALLTRNQETINTLSKQDQNSSHDSPKNEPFFSNFQSSFGNRLSNAAPQPALDPAPNPRQHRQSFVEELRTPARGSTMSNSTPNPQQHRQSFVEELRTPTRGSKMSNSTPNPQQHHQSFVETLRTPAQGSPMSNPASPYLWEPLPAPNPDTPSAEASSVTGLSTRASTPAPLENVATPVAFTLQPRPIFSNGYGSDPYNDMKLPEREPYNHEFTFPESSVPIDPSARRITMARVLHLRNIAERLDKHHEQILDVTADLLDTWMGALDTGVKAEILRFRALAFHFQMTDKSNIKAIRNIREACEALEKLKPKPGETWKFPVFDGYLSFENAMEMFRDSCADMVKYRRSPFSNMLLPEQLTDEEYAAENKFVSYDDPVKLTNREFMAQLQGRPRREYGM